MGVIANLRTIPAILDQWQPLLFIFFYFFCHNRIGPDKMFNTNSAVLLAWILVLAIIASISLILYICKIVGLKIPKPVLLGFYTTAALSAFLMSILAPAYNESLYGSELSNKNKAANSDQILKICGAPWWFFADHICISLTMSLLYVFSAYWDTSGIPVRFDYIRTAPGILNVWQFALGCFCVIVGYRDQLQIGCVRNNCYPFAQEMRVKDGYCHAAAALMIVVSCLALLSLTIFIYRLYGPEFPRKPTIICYAIASIGVIITAAICLERMQAGRHKLDPLVPDPLRQVTVVGVDGFLLFLAVTMGIFYLYSAALEFAHEVAEEE